MFIKKKSENDYVLNIYVKPNSNKQEILEDYKDNDYITILIRSKATQNKANKELINLLKNKLKIEAYQINIISGFKNQNKVIRMNFNKQISKDEILKRLLN